MDALDTKILRELMKNSRLPLTMLSKKVRASREVVTYRIERLKRDKVILGFITEIDFWRMGFKEASLFLSIKASGEKELKEFLARCPFAAWSSEFSGVWNFGVGIYGNTIEEINEHFKEICETFKKSIINYRLNVHTSSIHFYNKYFGIKNAEQIEDSSNVVFLDKKDKIILKNISTNSRCDSVSLSGMVGLTAPAVSKRIKRLEKIGIIKKYSLFIDPSKLSFFQYSIFIKGSSLDKKDKLLSYLQNHHSVSFVVEYLGDPFLEFGLIVRSPYDLRKILQKIGEDFPENKVLETFLIQEEILSIGPPECIFK